MASAFAHGLLAVALAQASWRQPLPWYFWVLAVGSSILPDIDVLGFYTGIEYGDRWGHRGMTHSLLFAWLWAVAITVLCFPQRHWRPVWFKLMVFFFIVTASHGVLDAMTNGGLGVSFFSPWDDTRYFFPFRPLQVSPLSIEAFFAGRGAAILMNELGYLALPCLLLFAIGAWRRYRRRVGGVI